MPHDTSSRRSPRSPGWTYALIGICALAAALRLLGISYGLPAIYNPDETPILNRALAIRNDLKPQNFVYPSLYFYLLFIWEGLFFVAGRLVGIFDSLAAFQRDFFMDPSRHFLAGRVFSVLCGTITVAAVCALGRRLYGWPTGLAAAAALAVAPIAVRDAHYVKLDIPTTMFVVFAHLALARIVVEPSAAARRGTWIVAGVLSGLAVSTQYYAIFLGFTMIAVAAADLTRSRSWRETLPLFLWSVLGAAIGFFAGTPFLPFALEQAIADIAHVREVDVDRALVGGAFSAAGPYLRILLWDAVGWPVWLAALGGFASALLQDWRRGLFLVSFLLPFFVFIANTVPMSRYLNVVLPIVALAAGVAFVRLGRLTGRDGVVTPALVAAALIPGAVLSIRTDLFIRQADTRTLAGHFIEARVPAGTSLLVQPYGPPLRQSREALVEGLRANLGSESRASIKFRLMLGLDPYPQPAYRLIYLGDGGLDADKVYVSASAFTSEAGLEPLRTRGIDYVVLKRGNVPDPGMAGLERALAAEGALLAAFSPYRASASPDERLSVPPFLHNTSAVVHPALERPGPTIEVWSVRTP